MGNLKKTLKGVVVFLFSVLLFVVFGNIFAYIGALLGFYGSTPLIVMGLPEISLFNVDPEVQTLVSIMIILLSALFSFIVFNKLMKRFVV